MPDYLELDRYISYLRTRWTWVAGSCAVAVALAFAASLAMTRQYTATARLLIEPPAGADLRSSMAVSPIYLESLKTYEQFASSDSLFQKAMERFQLHGGAIESMKRRVLKVGLVRNTRILEISATLPDPRKAQALAAYLADATVALNRSVVNEGDQDLIKGIEQQEHDIRARLDQAEAAWTELVSREPVAMLESEMEHAGEMRSGVAQQIANVELELADAAERQKTPGADAAQARKEESNARARLTQLRAQLATLAKQDSARDQLLATRQAHRARIESQRKAALAELAAVEARLREVRGEAGYRGERLRIVDPGIVPERPSSPNLPLNVAAAFLLGLILPIVFLAVQLSYREQRAIRRPVYKG